MKKLLAIFIILICFPVSADNTYLLNDDYNVIDEYKINNNYSYITETTEIEMLCFETSTNSNTTSCLNVPGGNGMMGICSSEGCYDRAKIEFNKNDNSKNIRYAIQIATNSIFTENVQYISGANRIPKSELTINDFLYICQWEGEKDFNNCYSNNETYQKYNILGLKPNTLYYARSAALISINQDSIKVSDWSKSFTAATSVPKLAYSAIYKTNNLELKVNTNNLSGYKILNIDNKNLFAIKPENQLTLITGQLIFSADSNLISDWLRYKLELYNDTSNSNSDWSKLILALPNN